MEEDMKCSLCTDPETSENPIITCIGCGLSVHILCYGIESSDETWNCSPCEAGASEAVCKLCVQNGGALKKTTCGGWTHVLCALFTEGCDFVDNNVMEPVDISKVSDSKRNKMCVFCKNDRGFSPLCSKHNCKNRLHISCAHKNSCLKEEEDKQKKIKFRAYCSDHKPTSKNRRISSIFVRSAVMTKNEKSSKKSDKAKKNAREKCEKEKISDMNTNWLFDKAINTIEPSSSKQRKRKNKSNGQSTLNGSVPKQPKLLDSSNTFQWDSFDLNNLKPDAPKDSFLDNIFEEAEKENVFHTCYKDKEISKVS